MGQMTETAIKKLYEYGKHVFSQEMSLEVAAEQVNRDNPEVAISSAKHYINWYAKMREGNHLTWSSNRDLLLYYVSHIIDEENKEVAELAIKAARQYARFKHIDLLDSQLIEIAKNNELELLQLEQVENANADESIWLPLSEEYDPGITKEQWLELLDDREIFWEDSLMAMACMVDNGGYGSCSELSNKYKHSMTLWRTSCGVHLSERIAKSSGCKIMQENGNNVWFVIPFLYKKASKNEQGSYIYRLRPELKEALIEFGIERFLKMGEENVQKNNIIAQIKKYISAKGFTFDDGLVENYYLSLKSKPFVILAGTSGTGKTRLVRLFAEAIGATVENGRYKLVPVRPDWSDSSDLFGHVDLHGHFIPSEIIRFVKDASKNKDLPYFLCLDEMNLARVEYYLSDILSVIETRELVNGEIVTDPLISEAYYGEDDAAKNYFGVIRIPENLYIIGTVNMDETTFPFSKKVLDRANTIEFSTVDFSAGLIKSDDEVEPLNVENSFMRADYVLLKQCADKAEHIDLVNRTCAELQKINNELKKANAHVGYRVRDEISFYMVNNEEANLLDYKQALDNEIMQKILPRIQGSSVLIKNMLCELFKICAGNYESYQTENDNVSAKMFARIKNKECDYKHSAEKIAYMVRRFEEDGFTAYWL